MPKRYDPSRDRKQLERLLAQIEKILETFSDTRPALRARVERLRRRCGKDGCRCQDGGLHESVVLVDRSSGERKIRKVRPGEQLRLRKLTRRYRDLRRGRAQLSKLHAEVLSCCDRLYEHRLREGQRSLE